MCSRGLVVEGSEKEDVNDHRQDVGDEISENWSDTDAAAARADATRADQSVGSGWVAAIYCMEKLSVFFIFSFLIKTGEWICNFGSSIRIVG